MTEMVFIAGRPQRACGRIRGGDAECEGPQGMPLRRTLITCHLGVVLLMALAGSVAEAASTPVTPAERARIETFLEVGYYFQVVDPAPIKMDRDPGLQDPLRGYRGCGVVTVVSGFPAQLSVRATGTSAAAGKWNATIRPAMVDRGTAMVRICVGATGLSLENLQAGSKLKVAEVVVTVIPR